MARFPYQNNSDDIKEFDPDLGDVVHFETSYEYLFAIVSVEFIVILVNFYCQKNIATGSPLFVSYLRKPFVQARFRLSLEQRVIDCFELSCVYTYVLVCIIICMCACVCVLMFVYH